MTRQEQERLYEANIALVGYVINREHFSPPYPFDEDDLQAVGQAALWAAVTRFDPQRGYRFSTFAVTCVRGRMIRWMQTARKRIYTEQLEFEYEHEGVRIALVDARNIEHRDPPPELRLDVEAWLATLSPEERELLRWRYWDEIPVKEISPHVRRSKQTVYDRLARLHKRGRRALAGGML